MHSPHRLSGTFLSTALSPRPPRPPCSSSPSPSPLLATTLVLALTGCASPGVPRPPSLNLPDPVRDLTATRIGNTVELHLTLPTRSTDKLPLRGTPFTALFCRELDHQSCTPLPTSRTTLPGPTGPTGPTGRNNIFTYTDTLPPALTQGPAHILGYRVQILNPANHSAGDSAPAFTATGPAPPPVEAFHAEGSRLGIVLRWDPTATQLGKVTLQRQDLGPKPSTQQLTSPNNTHTSSLLDTSAKLGVPYRYIASRRFTVQLGGRAIQLLSAPSPAVSLTLQSIYPPLDPTGLTAAAFFSPSDPTAFAVDLIWQPVDEPNLIVPLAGYNLYREPLDATSARTRLNSIPIPQPSFHDATAVPTARYRYSVTAVDAKGNQSGPASTLLEPSKP